MSFFLYCLWFFYIIFNLFPKNEKQLKILIHAVRIYSQYIGMELCVERCAMLVMKKSSSSFFSWHIHSMSSLEYKLSCLVLFLTSSLVHFKNGPEYLTRWTAQIFISFMGIFLVHLRFSFLIFFSFIFPCLIKSADLVVIFLL